jgi:hypothetical protein
MKSEREIENLLERFSPKPAPPGLRGRVLQAAGREAISRQVLTRGWRWVLATGFILMAAFTLADWRVSSAEQNQLDSLLSPHGAGTLSPSQAEEVAAAEILASLPDLDPASRQALTQAIFRDRSATGRSRKDAPQLTEEIHEY